MFKIKNYFILIFFVFSFLKFSQATKDESKEVTQKKNFFLQKVTIKKMTYKDKKEKITIDGFLHPYSEFFIYPEIRNRGIVRKIFFNEGDFVKKNEILMELDQKFTQMEDYLPFKVRAQKSGFISQIFVKLGELVSYQSQLFKIVDLKKLKLNMDFSLEDMEKIKKETPLVITLNDIKPYQGKSWLTKVQHIVPQVDTNSQKFKVTAFLENPKYLLIPGLKVKVDVLFDFKKVILVPLNMVKVENNLYYVYVYDYKLKKVFLREVQLGHFFDNQIEILSGVTEGEYLVEQGLDFIIDGQSVEIFVPNK